MDPARSPEQVGSGFQSLLETRAQLHSLVAERDALANQNERLPEEQLLFAFEEIEATLAGNAAEAGKASPTLRDTQARRCRARPSAGASAAGPRCAHRRRCAGIGLVAMAVTGMQSSPPIHYPARRGSASAAQ